MERNDGRLAESALALAVPIDSGLVGRVSICKSFGIIGPKNEVYKFRVNAGFKSPLSQLRIPNTFDDHVVISTIPLHLLEDYKAGFYGEKQAYFQVYNLNSFGVKISIKASMLPFGPNGFDSLTFLEKILPSGGHATLQLRRKVFVSNRALEAILNQLIIHIDMSVEEIFEENPNLGLKTSIAHLFNGFHDKPGSDFKIRCGGEIFHVHKFVLSLWSESLAQMLAMEGVQEVSNSELVISDFSPDTVATLIRYLYTEVLEPKTITCDLFKLADKYFINRLAKICEGYLAQFGRSTPESIVELAATGHAVNSKLLLKVAWNELDNCKERNPELAQLWAQACEKMPSLSIDMSKLLTVEKSQKIQKCGLSKETKNVTLIG